MITNEDFRKLTERVKILEEKSLESEKNQNSKKISEDNKKQSIKEFILSKKPKDDVQKTLSIFYYLENNENLESVCIKDIERGFREAKESVPKNINDKVAKNICKGLIMNVKEQKGNNKAWVLTNSGEKSVENGFKKE
ncbi:hypothetical protein J4466_05575 [Candidatus Pacearchaeota archaeon]|nr:hypothetical protein [Candidatus Pacearchaeota archaeon]